MRLIKVQNINTGETRYFTCLQYASQFMNAHYQSVKYACYGDSDKPFKREWKIEMTDDPEIKNSDIVK